MNWTKFKENYLFSINFSIMLSIVLYGARKDFTWHPAILGWTVSCLINVKVRESQKVILKWIGLINSTMILTGFYFLFFTPFSLLYRACFRNSAFKETDSRFVKKTSISDFDRPF